MHQRHRRAGLGEPVGGFKSKQSAADHHHALLLRSQRQQQVDVPAVAKRVNAGEIRAWYVQPQRRRARGQDQFRKRNALVVFDLEFAPADIDFGGHTAIFQGDAAVAPPRSRPELDVCEGLARQHRRQQHAVIGEPRLVADHGNGVTSEPVFASSSTRRAAAIPLPTMTSGSLTRYPYSAAWALP
jgi:hypothetical protein